MHIAIENKMHIYMLAKYTKSDNKVECYDDPFSIMKRMDRIDQLNQLASKRGVYIGSKRLLQRHAGGAQFQPSVVCVVKRPNSSCRLP